MYIYGAAPTVVMAGCVLTSSAKLWCGSPACDWLAPLSQVAICQTASFIMAYRAAVSGRDVCMSKAKEEKKKTSLKGYKLIAVDGINETIILRVPWFCFFDLLLVWFTHITFLFPCGGYRLLFSIFSFFSDPPLPALLPSSPERHSVGFAHDKRVEITITCSQLVPVAA